MLGPAPTRLTLEVALAPAQVRERLRASIDSVASLLLSPTWRLRRPIVGRVEEDRFSLRVRHGYSNGLTRIAYGRLRETRAGSRIEVEFRTLRFVVVVLRMAQAGILGMAALVLRELPRADPRPAALWIALLAPALVLGFLIGIEALARRMGRGDEQVLRRRLRDWFEDVAGEP